MKQLSLYIFIAALFFSCNRQQYVVSKIDARRIPVVADKNLTPNAEIVSLVNKYKSILDKEMSQVIGYSDQEMSAGQPESLLTNLTSDVLLQYANSRLDGNCDVSFMNVHGHRAGLAKGNITVGNIYEIYSFENALVVLKLKGSDLMDAFKSYAQAGGAGVSSTVRLIVKNKELTEAKVKNKPVDPDKIYTIITLDYLADGNDGMESLKNAVEVKPLGITLRDVMLQYIQEETKQGRHITSKLDNRITIEK